MPYLAKSSRRPWVAPPAPKKPYQQHSARTSDYDSKEWKALRKELIRRQPICSVVGCGKPTKVADHVKPVRLGGGFYDINNLNGLCWSHHQSKSSKEKKLKPE